MNSQQRRPIRSRVGALTLVVLMVSPLVPAGVAYASIRDIQGEIVDPRGTPLIGVHVTDNRGQTTSTSSPGGSYILKEDLLDTYRVSAFGEGLDSKTETVDPVRSLTDVDFTLTYATLATLSASAISTAAGPNSVTLTVTTHAPEPGLLGEAGKSCVDVIDARSGTIEAATFLSTDSLGTSAWIYELSLQQNTNEGTYPLSFAAKDCASGLILSTSPSQSVVYLVDNTAPVIDAQSLFPGDMTNTIFTSQKLGVRVVDAGGSEIAPGGVTFALERGGGHSQQTSSYNVNTGWAVTSPTNFSLGEIVRIGVIAQDNAGNVSSVTQAKVEEGGGFAVSDFKPQPTTASFVDTSCELESDPANPLVKRAICRNVSLVYAPTTVWVGSSRHSFDQGYVEHTVSLATTLLESTLAGVPVTLNAFDSQSPAWADKTQDLPFRLPDKSELGQTLTVQGFSHVIPELIVKDVPLTWSVATLRMPPVQSRGTASVTDTTPWTSACPDPSILMPKLSTCSPDPTLNRFIVSVKRVEDGGPPGRVADLSANLTNPWSVLIRQISDDRANRSFEVEMPSTAVNYLAANGAIDKVVRGASVERLINADRFMRSGLGFNDSVAHVKSLYFDPSLTTRNRAYGAVLTPAEETELRVRLKLQEDGPKIEQYVSQHSLIAVFGGIYLDHQAGGLLTVGFTRDAELHSAALTELVANPGRFRVVTVSKTLEELQARITEIQAEEGTLFALGFDLTWSETDTKLNQVRIKGVEVSSKGCASASARYPDVDLICGVAPQKMFTQQVSSPLNAARNADSSPWTPGIPIENTGEGTCTLGFSLRLNGAGEYLSTAGHCVGDVIDDIIRHAGSAIGEVWAKKVRPDPGGDMAAIRVTNGVSRNGVVYKEYPDIGLVNSVRSREAQQGWTVCMSGGQTFHHCGTVVSTNAQVDLPSGTGGLRRWTDIVSVRGDTDQNPAAPGDSGAPVWIPDGSDPAVAHATGLLLGGGGDNYRDLDIKVQGWYYTHLTESSGAFMLSGYSIRLCSC